MANGAEFRKVNLEETVRLSKEIAEINKQIEDRVEKINKVHGAAKQAMIANLDVLKQEKKIKEEILSIDEDTLSTMDKEATLSYDIKAAQEKINKLEEQKSKLSAEELENVKDKIGAQKAILTQNIEMAAHVQTRAKLERTILGGLYMSRAAMQGLVSSAKALTMILLTNPLLLIGAALAVAAKLMLSFIGYTQRLSSELGITANQAENMALQMKVIEIEGKIIGYDARQTAKALTTEFGKLNAMSTSNIRTLGRMQASLGISTETSAKLAKTFTSFNGEKGLGTSVKRMKDFAAMAISNGVVVGDVMNDIASNTEVFAEFARDGGDNIAKAAIQARKLGLSIADTAKMASSLLDFESSIEKEMEASLMIGKQLNFNKARQLALEGDIAGAAKSVIDQVGGKEAFQNMNVLQRRSVAAAAGVDVSTLMKMMGGRDDMGVKDATAEATREVNKSVGITNKFADIIAQGTDKVLGVLNKIFDFLKNNSDRILNFLKTWGPYLIGLAALPTLIRGIRGLFKITMSIAKGFQAVKSFIMGGQTTAKVGSAVMKATGKKVSGAAAQAAVKKGTATALTKTAGKAAGKTALKKIPIIGALAGLGFAGMRAMKGDFTGAGLELASGAASTIPGVGTAASLGLDTVLLGRDIARAGDASEEANAVNEAMLEQEKQAQQQQMEAQRQAGVKADETNAMMLNYGEQQNFLLQDIYNNISTLNDSVKNLRDE